METGIWINQKKAVEWDLSMGEAMVFGYVVNSFGWMTQHSDQPGYYWCANAKLAAELPIVCGHKDSAKRHMASLESKGLIERLNSGNKSYFRLTEKAAGWKSDTLKPDESARPSAEGRTNLPDMSDESARPRSDESAPQSGIPITSGKKKARARPRPSADEEQSVVTAYHAALPDWPRVSPHGWTDSLTRKHLLARWRDKPNCREPGFWPAFFAAVRLKVFWNTGRDGQPIEQARLSWLLTKSKFEAVIEIGLEAAA